MIKKGDTLIEVTLAIGIFSMVAIAIVAVMVSGTSNAQITLETTLTREEIDSQAEALRFIHDSYLADEGIGDGNEPYTKLWKKIISKAYVPNGSATDEAFQQYTPSSCQEIYEDGNEALKRAFVINPRALNNLTESNFEDPLISYAKKKFIQTSTYPRLLYTSEADTATNISKVEGLYVVAVVDPNSTQIIGADANKASAYIDFYIRTCWYGNGSETPSTISTVIRLYDPEGLPKDPVDSNGSTNPIDPDPTPGPGPTTPTIKKITVTYNSNGGSGTMQSQTVEKNTFFKLRTNTFTAPSGKIFARWSTSKTGQGGVSYYNGQSNVAFDSDTTLYAQWENEQSADPPTPSVDTITITYNKNGGVGSMSKQTVEKYKSVKLKKNTFTSPLNYDFKGWNTKADGSGTAYEDSAVVAQGFGMPITLYAQWYPKTTLTFEECKNLASTGNLSLIDTRDGIADVWRGYYARFINGRCWMTSNLKYAAFNKDFYYQPRNSSMCPEGDWRLPTLEDAYSLQDHYLEFDPEMRGLLIGYPESPISSGIMGGTEAHYWLAPGSEPKSFYITWHQDGIHFIDKTIMKPYIMNYDIALMPIRCVMTE